MVRIIEANTDEGRALVDSMLSRSTLDMPNEQAVVDEIIRNVRGQGSKALFQYIRRFDGAELDKDSIRVTKREIEEAYQKTDERLLSVLRNSAKRITAFHERQKSNSWFMTGEYGEILGSMVTPMETAAIYAPGGKAAYPSSVLMNALPAKIAGVKKIVMATPARSDGSVNHLVIVAAAEAGVDEIYKMGGAHAIAAFAFGTEATPKADIIVGPGNIYVALAKRAVFGYVNIDSFAGPSEILIVADETANPAYVAADMLSQAEHDELASAICVTTDRKLAEEIAEEAVVQAERLERKDIIDKSLTCYGAVIVVDSLRDAVSLANKIAPEHLELCCKEPFALLPEIRNAGAVFLGNYTPEPLGDYMAGPNHVLPTGGTARFFSPLSVDNFVKKSSVLYFSQNAANALADDVMQFANAEGLTGHANSVGIRSLNCKNFVK